MDDRTVRSNRVLRKHSIGRELQTTACSIGKCMINLSNKGSSGVDGMKTTELMNYLVHYWSKTKEELLAGKYKPLKVRGVEIPKKSGGSRLLGIPTVLDRMIQQSIHQVLSPIWEREFSTCSYGFRRKRGASNALAKASEHINAGYQWIIDLDLKSFFDKINHDKLMSIVERKVSDKVLLKLIRSYLQSMRGVKN